MDLKEISKEYLRLSGKLQARLWRPALTSDEKDYCAASRACDECKPPRTSKAPSHPVPSACSLQRVEIDIIGPLPKTKPENQYILTVQCSFTKWLEAYLLANQKAVTCARAIMDNWVTRFRMPDSIHSDQVANFCLESSINFIRCLR